VSRRIGGRKVATSNEEKVLFPRDGITKGDLIDYYARVAEHLLPWLRDRPLVLQRFPDGIGEGGFYQKQVAGHFPDWVRTTRVATRDGQQELVVCNDAATLVYLANLGCVTLHPWLSRRDRPGRPNQMVIDLDPAEEDFGAVRRAGRACRALLDELGLPSYPKLSGSRGLHVVVPLERAAGFDAVRDLARDAMELLARRHPDQLTTEVRKRRRRGRLYLDVARNAWAQTAVAPFAVRALPGAPVAVPIRWDELGRMGPRDYGLRNVFRRLSRVEDPWHDFRRRACGLGAARRALARARDRADGESV